MVAEGFPFTLYKLQGFKSPNHQSKPIGGKLTDWWFPWLPLPATNMEVHIWPLSKKKVVILQTSLHFQGIVAEGTSPNHHSKPHQTTNWWELTDWWFPWLPSPDDLLFGLFRAWKKKPAFPKPSACQENAGTRKPVLPETVQRPSTIELANTFSTEMLLLARRWWSRT